MKAEQFLRNGADVLAERGKEYDKPEGERSMARTVAAFKAITGKELTEAEGWLFMECLKNVRQWQNPDRYHEDSAVDGVNYSALKAEALSEKKPIATAEDLMLGAETLSKKLDGKPDWKDAPEWANVLVRNKESGEYEWATSFDFCADVTEKLIDRGLNGLLFGKDFAHFWSFVEPRP